MTPVQRHLHHLEHTDIDTCTTAELAALAESCRQLDSYVTYTNAHIARRAHALKAVDKSAPDPDDVMANHGRTSTRKARKATRRARTVGQLPRLGDELANGTMSSEHLDAATAAQHGLTDAERQAFAERDHELAAKARTLSPEAFATYCRRIVDTIKADRGESRLERQRRDSYVNAWVDPATGMVRLNSALDPIRGETVLNALNTLTDSLINTAKNDPNGTGLGFTPLDDQPVRREQYAAQALTLLASATLTNAGRADLTIIVDADTLAHGPHDHSVAETANGAPVPPTTLARLCCDAVFQAVAVDPLTVALNVGRRHRVATQAQRGVLRALHADCVVDGCDVPFDQCHIHHILEWEHGGPTDLANLIPLCWRHHHLVHEGAWRLAHSVTTPGQLFLTDPGGSVRAVCRPTRLDDWRTHRKATKRGRTGPGATRLRSHDSPQPDTSGPQPPGLHTLGSDKPSLIRNRATERQPTNN